jgi:hypothetical protein
MLSLRLVKLAKDASKFFCDSIKFSSQLLVKALGVAVENALNNCLSLALISAPIERKCGVLFKSGGDDIWVLYSAAPHHREWIRLVIFCPSYAGIIQNQVQRVKDFSFLSSYYSETAPPARISIITEHFNSGLGFLVFVLYTVYKIILTFIFVFSNLVYP